MDFSRFLALIPSSGTKLTVFEAEDPFSRYSRKGKKNPLQCGCQFVPSGFGHSKSTTILPCARTHVCVCVCVHVRVCVCEMRVCRGGDSVPKSRLYPGEFQGISTDESESIFSYVLKCEKWPLQYVTVQVSHAENHLEHYLVFLGLFVHVRVWS